MGEIVILGVVAGGIYLWSTGYFTTFGNNKGAIDNPDSPKTGKLIKEAFVPTLDCASKKCKVSCNSNNQTKCSACIKANCSAQRTQGRQRLGLAKQGYDFELLGGNNYFNIAGT